MNNSVHESLEALRGILRSIRSSTPGMVFPRDVAASSDIRTGYIDGLPVRRLVITLRAPGCSWVKAGGGCTMCGHYAGTTRGALPSADEFVSQFRTEISRYDPGDISVLSIYNSGSMLNPDEIGFDALKRIFMDIRRLPAIKKVVLETRACYADRAVIGELLDILGPDRRLFIAMGLETADDLKRELCVNKGCTAEEIRVAVRMVKGLAGVQLYVLSGLPFLTEREALDDTIQSLRFAHEMGADEIHIEPVTLQRYTLVELLCREGLFRLPSLYTLYEVLRAVVPEIRPYVSPFLHMPRPAMIPEGCPSCTNSLLDGLLNRYNIFRDRQSLEYDWCTCIPAWRERLDETDERPLASRVMETLDILADRVAP
ncbi:hypothetical protein LLG96_07285 [bacterium]|nr:hypothetical protein [bacterium]